MTVRNEMCIRDSDYKAPDAEDVLRRFLTATAPYIKAGVSIGGDLGVDYSVVLRILDDLGIGIPQTKAMKEDPDIHQGILNPVSYTHLPLATLPGAIFSVWHNIAGSIFAGIRRAGAENLAELKGSIETAEECIQMK